MSRAALLLLCLALCSCAAPGESVTVLRVWDSAEQSASQGKGAEERHILMLTDTGGVRDASFNQSAWEGLQSLAKSTGAKVDYLEPASDESIPEDFDRAVNAGADLCWGIGYSFSDTLWEAAERWPDVQFAIVDSSYDPVPDNVTGVLFRAQEPSFLVGFIAAAVTTTGRIGFVGGMSGPEMDAFQYGYQSGAAYGAAQYGKSVACEITYAESYTDPALGKQLALALYDGGCDIVYHAAGSTGTGVIEAAEQAGLFAICVDRDQSYLSPKHVLTSALKNVGAAVERVSIDYIEHNDIGGRTFAFGLAEGAVGIPEEHPNYPDEIYDAVLQVEDDIIAEKLVPAADEASYRAFLSAVADGKGEFQ